MRREGFYIDGEWRRPLGSSRIDVLCPTSQVLVGSAPMGTRADVDGAVDAARRAFDGGPWRDMSSDGRARVLEDAASRLDSRRPSLEGLFVSQNGSTRAFARDVQVGGPISSLRYYADLVRTVESEEIRSDARGSTLVVDEPVGVVAAIVPWNAPLHMAVTKIAPALAVGCSVVLKPALETPLDSYELADVFMEAGLPPGVLNIVTGGSDVGQVLVSDDRVDKVSFTGSTAAGRKIMSACGRGLRRVGLELGGKSAAIILDDADIQDTVQKLLPLVFMNSGQTCVMPSRLLVPEHKANAIVSYFIDAARTLITGDPRDDATDLGPLISSKQRDRVEAYIKRGEQEGARIAFRGRNSMVAGTGWFVEPTVLVDVKNNMTVAQEEIFGPVVSVIEYSDEDEAIRIANDSPYGLSGSVWSGDPDRGLRVARSVRTGHCTVNGSTHAQAAPFGGFKNSGIGREMGVEGLLAYTERRSIAHVF